MKTLLHKEFREGWRTWRFGVLVIILAVSGLISPLLAYYTPALLRMANLPGNLGGLIPEPSIADAVAQFIKNGTLFGQILLVVFLMGSISGEKERGTAAMLFVRPVERSSFVLAKWLTWVGVLAVAVIVGGLLAYAYTLVLFGGLPLGPFLALNALLFASLLPYLSVALLASALTKSQGAAAGLAFGSWLLLLLIGSLPRIGEFMPAQLVNWGAAATLGGALTAWPALGVTLAIVAVALIVACLRVEREEL